MGNLPFSAEDADIREWFSEIGEITNVRFGVRDGKRMGYAHVDFARAEDAAKAVQFDGEELDGRPLRIDLSERRARELGLRNEGTRVGVRSAQRSALAVAAAALRLPSIVR